MSDFIKHYGTPRHSGRYPWGSGKDPYQHGPTLLKTVEDLKAKGFTTEKKLAKAMGMSTTTYRNKLSIAKEDQKKDQLKREIALKDKGLSNMKIAEIIYGDPSKESTVRNHLKSTMRDRLEKTRLTANALKQFVDANGLVDVGEGANLALGVTDTQFNKSVAMLEMEGYKTSLIKIPQMGTNHRTTILVLSKNDVPYKEIQDNKYSIVPVGSKVIKSDGTRVLGNKFPLESVASDRIFVRFNEDGGGDKDGVIELRRGVEDISLKDAKYAQVRIAVDGTHYMKGMAMYNDNIPKGYDIVYNSHKHEGTPLFGSGDNTVFKKLKEDPTNPFGASIKDEEQLKMTQRYYTGSDGKQHLSAINIVNEEGSWNTWRKTLSSQMLSKQLPSLAKRQLDLSYAQNEKEYESIMALENPTVKRYFLAKFAESCDAASVDLKAAALPRQSAKVILPFPELKDNEVYAPTYNEGEHVCLIRFPHGGTFEIPELVVHNKGSAAAKVIGNATDAIGINHTVASRLSGADFDGDTVLVIPVNSKVKIRTQPQLKGLIGFDPQESYAIDRTDPIQDKIKPMDSRTKGIQMGVVSNLITDMTLQGANADELARATRHSMVVIDSEKHDLNWRQSEIDNGIDALKDKYQNKGDGTHGASTLISRAGAEIDVPERKDYFLSKSTIDEEGNKIYRYTEGVHEIRKKVVDPVTKKQLRDPVTGKKLYTYTGKFTGNTQKSTQMAETNDAYTLSSGTQMEGIYANYANQMKALANRARKEYVVTERLEMKPEAKKRYAPEVSTLMIKLNEALKNAPRERQAQLIANQIVDEQVKANPDIDDDHLRKLKGRALDIGRKTAGASKQRIAIEPKEWEAIQAGAVSDTTLMRILRNTDTDVVRSYAMPKNYKVTTPANVSLAKRMQASGYTLKEIADRIGVSTSTVSTMIHS